MTQPVLQAQLKTAQTKVFNRACKAKTTKITLKPQTTTYHVTLVLHV